MKHINTTVKAILENGVKGSQYLLVNKSLRLLGSQRPNCNVIMNSIIIILIIITVCGDRN